MLKRGIASCGLGEELDICKMDGLHGGSKNCLFMMLGDAEDAFESPDLVSCPREEVQPEIASSINRLTSHASPFLWFIII